MLSVALLLNITIIVKHTDCVWGYVLSWASFWIAHANPENDTVRIGSLLVAGIIALVQTYVTIGVVFTAFDRRHDIDNDENIKI